jgi:hypothetical protein
MNQIDISKDFRRAIINSPIRWGGVEPAGGEKGEKAKPNP